jgi:ParB family chromosome partitioning protein
MRNRETAHTFFDRTDGRNSRKIFNEKETRTSQTETCKKSFAELLPSEKAAIMKMLYNMNYDPEQQDALQNEEEFGYYGCRCRSRKELTERFGYSSRNVARYLRINELIQPIKDLVDTSRISLVAAVELSYLDAGEQWLVYRGILSRGLKLIHRAAEELRKHSGELTEEMMIDQFGSANTSRNSLVSSDTTVSGGLSVMI